MTNPVETLPPGAEFTLGRVELSPSAAEWLSAEVIARSLERHQRGDWGDVSGAFAGEMDEALRQGLPVVSVYWRRGPSYTILTSADRTLTILKMSRDWCSGWHP